MLSTGEARSIKKTFSRETSVSIHIKANTEVIWALLTNGPDYTRWNSTIVSFEGTVGEKETIKLKSTLDPNRTFKLKVGEVKPENSMRWTSGAAPFFKGVRTYQLDTLADGTVTFSMAEKMGGLMFPLAAGQIPDFTASFEEFAADLKSEAEIIANSK
ncbi:MAG: hypothetical protein Roseis2KO_51230 [Roseivirga sp.]